MKYFCLVSQLPPLLLRLRVPAAVRMMTGFLTVIIAITLKQAARTTGTLLGTDVKIVSVNGFESSFVLIFNSR